MWIWHLYLHVNQKSDDDDDDKGRLKKKKYVFAYFFVLMLYIKFQVPSSSGSLISQPTKGVTDRRTDKQMDRPKPICPRNFFEVRGIKRNSYFTIWYKLWNAPSFQDLIKLLWLFVK